MKKLTKQLRDKTVKELQNQEVSLRSEIGKLRLEWKVKTPKDTNDLVKKRKNLAVVLTVLKEKQDLEKLQAQKKVTK